jgi:hypothetical protein
MSPHGWLGEVRTPCIVTTGVKYESSCLDVMMTYVIGKRMAVDEGMGLFTIHLNYFVLFLFLFLFLFHFIFLLIQYTPSPSLAHCTDDTSII